MGLIWNKRKKLGKSSAVNLSKRGASVSRKVGPLTVNSRGKASIGLGKGFRIKL